MNRMIPISFGAFFTGCLVFGLAHFLIAPRVHGACALDAVPFQTTYSAVCGAALGVISLPSSQESFK